MKNRLIFLILIAILTLAFYLRYIDPIKRADLPSIDAHLYSISAYNLYKYHAYSYKLMGQFYPPIHPFGYPLMIIPFYMIFGSQPYNAVYCSLFFSLLSIVFIYLIGKKVANKLTGIVAALFLTLCPLHIIYGKKIMAESLSTFLYLFVFWLFLKAIEPEQKRNVSLLLLMGLIIGFGLSVRYANLLIYPVIFVSLLYARNRNFKLSVREGAIVSLGVIIALIPLLLYNLHAYGSPLTNGYEYWNMKGDFSLKSFAYPSDKAGIAKQGNFIAYLSALLGIDKHFYPLAMFPLILIGGFSIVLKNKKVISTSKILLMFTMAITAFQLLFYSLYRFQRYRFFLEIVPFLLLVGAYSVVGNVPWHKFKWLSKRTLLSGVSCMLALVVMGQWGGQLYGAKAPALQNRGYGIIKEAYKYLENDAVVISHLDYFFAEHYLTANSERIFINADALHRGGWTHIAWLERTRPEPLVHQSTNITRFKRYYYLFRNNKNVNPVTLNFIYTELRRGRPVYFLNSPRNYQPKRFFRQLGGFFIVKKHKENPQLYKLYIKHW